MSYSCSATPKTPNRNLFSLIMNFFFDFFFGGGNTKLVPNFLSTIFAGIEASSRWRLFRDIRIRGAYLISIQETKTKMNFNSIYSWYRVQSYRAKLSRNLSQQFLSVSFVTQLLNSTLLMNSEYLS